MSVHQNLKIFFSQLFRPVPDSETVTRQHLLWWILLRMLLSTTLCTSAAVLRDTPSNAIVPPLPQTSFILLALYLFSIVSAVILQKSSPTSWKLRNFGLGQLWADALFVAIFVYTTGCSFSIFTPLFILPITAAGLILYKTGSLFLAATSTFFYATVLLIELSGLIPTYFGQTSYKPPIHLTATLDLFAFYGLLFFLTALISGQMGSRLHRTQQELRKTTHAYDQLAQLYQQIFDDISTGIITTDEKNRINSYNQAAECIIGYSREQVVGERLERYFPTLAHIEPTTPGRNVCDFTRQDGESIRIGYSLSRLNLPAEKNSGSSTSKAKVITLQDISQVERMERRTREAEKLAAIGEMSAQIAHDFRNPLAAISGSAQMLAMGQCCPSGGDGTDPAKALLDIILREADRMEKTIADFLLFARPRPTRQQWFELAPLVAELISSFLSENKRFAYTAIEWDLPAGLLFWADRQQVGDMLRQLVENACVAVQETAQKVVLRTQTVRIQGEEALALEVCDQGPGIPPELHKQIFIPFFSHRADGSGLGLAIVHQLVQQHGGTVSVHSEAAFNCVIRLVLPQPARPTR